MRIVDWLYRGVLRAYPPEFRARFGGPMRDAFFDRYAAARTVGRFRAAVVLLAIFADLTASAALLRFARREKTSMNWQSIGRDVRYGLRMLRRNPLFAAVAIGALALGIGANTAIFTVVNGVLLRPLPYADPGHLAMVWSTNTAEHRDHDAVAPLDFLDYRNAAAFSDLQATYSFVVGAALTNASGSAEQIVVTAVTPGMFEMLGRAPQIGRPFTAAEVQTAIVISDGFWRARLGADPAILGRTLNVNNQSRTIVGVMPPDFVFPYRTMLGPSGFSRSMAIDAWLPLEFVSADSRSTGVASLTRAARFLSVVGRLRPSATAAQANAELQGIARQLAAAHPDTNKVVGVSVVPLHEQTVGTVRPALILLFGGVGFVLLMACMNLANMLLARSSARQREMAIRAALGAGRARLIAQTLVETTLLGCAGGAIALIALKWGIGALIASAPGDMPRIGEVRPDAAVLGFTFVLSLATGLAIGIAPALAASKPELQASLKDSGRGATTGRSQRRLRSALVSAEVALALVLTLGAGLLLRSFLSVLAVDPGFRPDHLLTLQMTVPARYQTPDQRRALYAELFGRLGALPGVVTTGGTTRLPLGSTNVTTKVGVEGRSMAVSEWPEIEFRRAMHSYFTAMGMPIVRGRGFASSDGPAAPPVVVINQTMARQMFAGEDPIGRRVKFGSAASPSATIVGVVGDVRHSGLEAPPSPEVYTYYLQGPPVNPFIVIRTSTDPASLATAVRGELQAIDKEISVYDVRPMTQVRSEAMAQRRFLLRLVGAFGLLALVMAAAGVYGVMALIVSERSPEIGIRLALGAEPSQVVWSVVGQGLALAGAGVIAGFAASLLLSPVLSAQMFGVRLLDPPTVAVVPSVLLIVAALACYVPARRAMTIDPVDALRM
ncbi:MAG TPA: ABC transporter permease [Vicinamibacterales bacterium]|nr:ABC transporter permease [Vicinamibacterales bacterium]